jgi:hypothetical protein
MNLSTSYIGWIYSYTAFIVQAYQTSQHAMPRGDIFLGKWHSTFSECSDGKMKSNQPAL